MLPSELILKTVLVIQTASIGDVILATPVIEKIHSSFPDAKIDLLVNKGNQPLFNNHPFLNEVMTWNKSNNKYTDLLRILKVIRKNRYDAVINLQRFASTGFLTAFSGARIRTGFSKNPFSFLFSTSVPHIIRTGVHEAVRNLSLIGEITGFGNVKPKIYPSPEDFSAISGYNVIPYFTVSPGSLWFSKRFPPEKWIEVLMKVDKNIRVLFLGSGSDSELCDQIISSSGLLNSVNLAGKLSLLGSAALMKGAIMNFTNDSAPMHLASAVNAPVTVVFCSTVPEFGFGPLSDRSNIIETHEALACRPCGLHGFQACPEKHFKCATTIKPEQILDLLYK
jgi:heptosyltransferase II